MTRKRPPDPAEPPDFGEAWGWIPAEDRAERERLRSAVERNGGQIADPEAFDRELGAALREATRALYGRLRCDPRAVAAVLEDRLAKVAAAREALAPAYDADEAVDRAMLRDARNPPKGGFPWRALEGPPDGVFAPRWEERSAWALQLLGDIERLHAIALADLPKRGRGRPPDDIARRLVYRLGELWEAQTGHRPTLIIDPLTQERRGGFLELCEALVVPVWQSRGVTAPSVKDLVQEYCRHRVRGKNRPGKG
jgi:hypothetical protein